MHGPVFAHRSLPHRAVPSAPGTTARLRATAVPRGVARVAAQAMVIVCLVAAAPAIAAAQDEGAGITLRFGPTALDFAGFGGRFGAVVGEVGFARRFGANSGADLSAFGILPMGGARAEPTCGAPVGASCAARSSPSALSGFLLSPFAFVAGSDLRLTTGVGMVAASGGEGLARRSSVALAAGVDWVPDSRSRLAPSVGIRTLRLSSAVAGVRYLLLPGVGVRF